MGNSENGKLGDAPFSTGFQLPAANLSALLTSGHTAL